MQGGCGYEQTTRHSHSHRERLLNAAANSATARSAAVRAGRYPDQIGCGIGQQTKPDCHSRQACAQYTSAGL